ncbi:DeoR/GlpR family DNA-binding transcription regulator [Christensenella timonensis]|uniref:DeoR/GlpR family DNA-binding transcription regulator n=1 Tax=Christensenella timonensis TaxID=1816678 RepID=UPI0008349EEE|nr:DeoR/GlpR family DNA-binding transcription regulator [Christensenella timonensis]
MIASERKLYIMNCLNEKGIINLKEIAKELSISEITVRRDFEKLEKEGKLRRVQGGAALEEVLEDAELTMKERISINMDEKRRVAKYAAGLVEDGDCVFVDAGTSMVPLAENLVNKRIRLVTCNELILRKVTNPAAEIIVVGGKFLPYYSMTVGPIAQDVLKQFHFSLSFIGCTGIDAQQGVVYTTETESMLMKRIALENTDRCVLLMDDSKLQVRGFLKFAEVADFSTVVCNGSPPEGEMPDNIVFV